MTNAQRSASLLLAMYCSVSLGTCFYVCGIFGLPKCDEASYQKTIFLGTAPALCQHLYFTLSTTKVEALPSWNAKCLSLWRPWNVTRISCVGYLYSPWSFMFSITCEVDNEPLQLSTSIIATDHGKPPETRVCLLCVPWASISLWVQGRLAPWRSNNFDFTFYSSFLPMELAKYEYFLSSGMWSPGSGRLADAAE